MNTANLQLEGLYLALAAINETLVEKSVLTRDEVDLALRRAEQTALGDYRSDDLSPAERDAVVFGPRLLILANERSASGNLPSFSELAKLVGLSKRPHADQQ
jgi:hypothetical protein